MTTIINLFAASGAGKSTTAAYIFALLKDKQINSELVQEYVKGWAWEGRTVGSYDQFRFLGKQIGKEAILFNKVDAIVTDSPVWLCRHYASKYSPSYIARGINDAMVNYYNQTYKDGHKHINLWVNRSKPYNPKGRYQTESEAKIMDVEIRDYLRILGVELIDIETERKFLDTFIEDYLVKEIEKNS